jgi:hypothetical protein
MLDSIKRIVLLLAIIAILMLGTDKLSPYANAMNASGMG